MKIKWYRRNLEISKNRISVNDFKNERTLVAISFNRKQMTLRDWRTLFLFMIMPYSWLDDRSRSWYSGRGARD